MYTLHGHVIMMTCITFSSSTYKPPARRHDTINEVLFLQIYNLFIYFDKILHAILCAQKFVKSKFLSSLKVKVKN